MVDSNYIYWDSCIFIDGLRQTAGRFPHIQQIETEAKSGQLSVYVSTLGIAEVVKLREYGPLTEDEERAIAAYFRHKFMKVLPVDRIIGKSAAKIVREHSLKPPDAIHVATAIRARCCVLYTYDGELLDRHGADGPIKDSGMAIKRPGEFGQSTFMTP